MMMLAKKFSDGGKGNHRNKGTRNTPNKVNYGEQYARINGRKVLKTIIEI